jgi:phage FluMu protein Com
MAVPHLNSDNLPIVPHSDFGDEECCGCLYPVEHGDQVDLVCNECGALIQTVSITEVEPTLLRMAMSQGFFTATCPHCGALNTFPGFTSIEAYICKECGEGVSVEGSVQ